MNTDPDPLPAAEPKLSGWVSPPMLKTVGYLISTVSVILLAIVAWPNAKESPILLACLIGGAATSMIGMLCRWLSYEIEQRIKTRR